MKSISIEEETGEKHGYAQSVAEMFIKSLENKTAPWLKPWQPVPGFISDFNPVSSGNVPKPYNGINAIYLELTRMYRGYDDIRWCTFKQAIDNKWKIKENEAKKYTTISYFTMLKKDYGIKKDRDGKIVIGNNGEPERNIKNIPMFKYYNVYNANQIDGIPAYEAPEILVKEFQPILSAEKIIAETKAIIKNDQRDRAFYNYTSDTIHLPMKEAFKSSELYYSTALHEIGHWTGHETRLDRKLHNRFGTPDYAREELRAEIASYMIAKEIGIVFDPGEHIKYVNNWIEALKKDPKEILYAASDSEKILRFIMPEKRQWNKEKQKDINTISVRKVDKAKAKIGKRKGIAYER